MEVILKKLSYKNQIVLPAPILAQLEIRPQDFLEITKEDKTIRIRKAAGLADFYGSFKTGRGYSILEFEEIAKKKFSKQTGRG